MDAIFENLEWFKGTSGRLVQGIKGNKVPRNAVAGGNGSYIIKGTPSRIILTVRLANGERHSANVYRTILEQYGKTRMVDSLFKKVKAEMAEKKYYYDPETGKITWE